MRAATCAPSRSCSATRISPRRRSTRTSRSSACARSTSARIPAPVRCWSPRPAARNRLAGPGRSASRQQPLRAEPVERIASARTAGMLLTLTTTRKPATDLGYLLAKHPARTQSFDLTFGQAHVFYPQADEERCTAALLLDVDPVGLVRGGHGVGAPALFEYVNDRPYVASSFLSVALSQVLGSALNGRCKGREELAAERLPLEARLPCIACRGGPGLLARLFEPLGYAVEARRHLLDPRFPEWGDGPYYDVALRCEARVQDLLTHLYVLVPVLDDDKHYWVGKGEVEKLLEKGKTWLGEHPERELITRRYLKHQRHLSREVLARLAEEDQPDPDGTAAE